MNLQDRVYSILVVSAADRYNTALSSLLPESRYRPVRYVANVGAARRACEEQDYDYVLVNSPLPDDPGIRFAIDAAASRNTVVLLMVRAEFYDSLYDHVVNHGVFVIAKPLSRTIFQQALDWMASARERLRKLEIRSVSIEEKMAEIRLVNRAKWLLISELHMDEPQAHRYIEKQAMDQCVSRKEIAEQIIRTYT